LKTGALFVGEEGDGEWTRWFDSGPHEGFDHLEAGEHSQVAVVAAARAHGVDVRTGHDGGSRAHVPESDHIAHGVDRHLQTEVLHPRDDEVAPVTIGVGQGEPAGSTAFDRANLGQLIEARHESGRVDPTPGPPDPDLRPLRHDLTLQFVKGRRLGRIAEFGPPEWQSPKVTWLEVFGAGGGVLLAAAAQYTAGFGFSLLGVPLIALVLPTHDAVIISTWLGLLTNGFQMSRGWRAADRATVGRLLAGTVLGVPLGLVVFTRVDESVLKAVLGLTVLAATALLVADFRFRRSGNGPEWVAGVVSGALSASLSTNGPPLVFVLQARGVSMDVFRSTLAVVFTGANVATLIGFGFTGDLDGRTTQRSLIVLPFMIVGIALGSRLRRLVTESSARRLVLTLLGTAGVSAVLSAVIG